MRVEGEKRGRDENADQMESLVVAQVQPRRQRAGRD